LYKLVCPETVIREVKNIWVFTAVIVQSMVFWNVMLVAFYVDTSFSEVYVVCLQCPSKYGKDTVYVAQPGCKEGDHSDLYRGDRLQSGLTTMVNRNSVHHFCWPELGSVSPPLWGV
jgi:hypothetical protein